MKPEPAGIGSDAKQTWSGADFARAGSGLKNWQSQRASPGAQCSSDVGLPGLAAGTVAATWVTCPSSTQHPTPFLLHLLLLLHLLSPFPFPPHSLSLSSHSLAPQAGVGSRCEEPVGEAISQLPPPIAIVSARSPPGGSLLACWSQLAARELLPTTKAASPSQPLLSTLTHTHTLPRALVIN